MTGIVLQIGLEHIADYLYLTEGGKPHDPHKEIPKALLDRYDSWQYYGVDCDPSSINKMLVEHGTKPNAEWIIAHISEHGIIPELIRYPAFLLGKRDKYYHCPTMRLDQLIWRLGLDKIDVLAIDVESFELPILQGYSWKVKPHFIAVESHNNQDAQLKEIIISNGYDLVLDEGSNLRDGIYHTQELHFWRSEP